MTIDAPARPAKCSPFVKQLHTDPVSRAHPEAALVVTGGGAVVREGAEFAVPATMTDAELSEWRAVSITASREGVGRNGGDVSQTRQGKLWLPASPESFTYDADGNLTADGRWSYEWDAENRLKAMQTLPAATVAGVPAQRLEFAYDAQSRRIRKAVYQQGTENGEQVWQPVEDRRYLYDGWNMLAEFNLKPETSNLELVRSYAWGLDLSGTEQGAGGVGGLLLVHQTDLVLAPCYDGNGNIIAYVNLESGAVQAKFDYDPFGKPVWTDLSGTGELPPFRFSTKYEDAETGLVYYGFRYYTPELGRWMNRDPIEEDGGINLYGMVGNDAVNKWDRLGMHAGLLMGYDIVVYTKRRDRGFINWLLNNSYEKDLTLSGEIHSCTDENLIIQVENDPRDIVLMTKQNGPIVYAGADTISGREYPIGAPTYASMISHSPDMKGVVLWNTFGMFFQGKTANHEARILVPREKFKSGGSVDIWISDYDQTRSWTRKIEIK